MSSWGRCHSARATDVAAPSMDAVDIASLLRRRSCPVRRRSVRPISFTGLSAASRGRAVQRFLAARSHRALARRRYRAEALIRGRAGHSADEGLDPRTGRAPSGDGPGTAGLSSPGWLVLTTDRGFRPLPSRPYRAAGSFRSVPGTASCRSISCADPDHLGGSGGRSTTSGCTIRSVRCAAGPMVSRSVVPSDRGEA